MAGTRKGKAAGAAGAAAGRIKDGSSARGMRKSAEIDQVQWAPPTRALRPEQDPRPSTGSATGARCVGAPGAPEGPGPCAGLGRSKLSVQELRLCGARGRRRAAVGRTSRSWRQGCSSRTAPGTRAQTRRARAVRARAARRPRGRTRTRRTLPPCSSGALRRPRRSRARSPRCAPRNSTLPQRPAADAVCAGARTAHARKAHCRGTTGTRTRRRAGGCRARSARRAGARRVRGRVQRRALWFEGPRRTACVEGLKHLASFRQPCLARLLLLFLWRRRWRWRHTERQLMLAHLVR